MITYKELVCPLCDRTFKIRMASYNYEVKKNRNLNFHCSTTCKNAAQKKPLIEGTCKQCLHAFSRKSNGSKETAQFCSASCSAKHVSNSRKLIGLCKYCDNEIANSTKIICSECKNANVLRNISLSKLREKYSISQYHAKIRGNARQTFKRSGGLMSCRVCKYKLHVDVCHVRDVKDFDPTALIGTVNDPNNLVALCKNHHWEFDNGHLSIPPIDSEPTPLSL